MLQAQTRGLGRPAPSGFNYTKHNCNKPARPGCGKRTLAGLVDGKIVHQRHRCKSYQCLLCGPRKIRQVRKRIVALALEHQLQRFLTLTLDPKKFPRRLDLPKRIEFLQTVWRKMRVSLQRKLGHSLTFVAVVELQPGTRNPHLHLLVGSYLPKQWISTAWQALGGGWATRIEYVDLHRVAAYLAKYVTHESICDLPPRTRRFSASRGLALFDRSKGDGAWVMVKADIDFLRELCGGVQSESFETEPDGARSLRSFVADRSPLSEILESKVRR